MLVPAGFEPPLGLEAERDYAARSSSIEHIRASPGYGPDTRWPRQMTLEENLADLERHARDFADRKGFTYTVLDRDKDVIGCVYIYPARDEAHDVHVQSWVRESWAELDSPLREAVTEWLGTAWPFERPLYEPLLK
jgi:hypothetical protein